MTQWKSDLRDGSWQVLDDKEQLVCTLAVNTKDVGSTFLKGLARVEANARLITSSPYMLEALKSVSDLIGDEDLPDNGELSGVAICDMVRSAIELAS